MDYKLFVLINVIYIMSFTILLKYILLISKYTNEFIIKLNTYKIENEKYITSVQFIDYEKKIRIILYSPNNNITFYKCIIFFSNLEKKNCNPELVYNGGNSVMHLVDILVGTKKYPKTLVLNNLTITIPKSKRNKNDVFVSCNAVMSNYDRPLMLIELIESNIHFGTSKIIFYHISSSNKIKQILHYYSKIGVVDVYQFKTDKYLKEKERKKETLFFHLNYFKLNHCFNEYKTETNHMFFLDLDEILWPVKVNNYVELISSIPKNEFYYIHAFFYKTDFDIPQDFDKREKKPIPDVDLFSVKKYCPSNDSFFHKYIIINTSKFLSTEVHDSISPYKIKKIYIPNNIAFVRHTRHFNNRVKARCPDSILMKNNISNAERIIQNISKTILNMF